MDIQPAEEWDPTSLNPIPPPECTTQRRALFHHQQSNKKLVGNVTKCTMYAKLHTYAGLVGHALGDGLLHVGDVLALVAAAAVPVQLLHRAQPQPHVDQRHAGCTCRASKVSITSWVGLVLTALIRVLLLADQLHTHTLWWMSSQDR